MTAFDKPPKASASAQESKETSTPVIPRGWTFLKHGTNLLKWSDTDPLTQASITLTRPLSVISQEEFERQQTHGAQYNTTHTYQNIAVPPGMSPEEFKIKNKPLELRVIFFQDFIQRNIDPEYKKGLDQATLDEIAKYYLRNHQSGRHPVVPYKEELVKVGATRENNVDVLYFVPKKFLERYRTEASNS